MSDLFLYEPWAEPGLEEVPDPWLIPAIDTRKPWVTPAMWRRCGPEAWDALAEHGVL